MAVENLLRLRVRVGRQIIALDTAAHGLTSMLESSGRKHLIEQVAGPAMRMNHLALKDLSPIDDAFARQVHTLISILAERHGVGPIPGLLPSVNGHSAHDPAVIADRFPDGFARDYVSDILADVAKENYSIPKKQAVKVKFTNAKHNDTIFLVAQQFTGARRELVRVLLSDPSCHAVYWHGDCVEREPLLVARV